MPTAPAATPLTLLSGDEELLVARAIDRIVRSARERDPDVDVRTFAAESLDTSALLDLTTPSLFGELRVAVIRLTGALSDDVRDALLGQIANPDPDVWLVLAHPGGNVAKKVVDAAKAAGAQVVPCAKVDKLKDRIDFVQQEFAACGRPVSEATARALLDAVGGELRELAGACAQLVGDTAGDIDDRAIARFFRGRAEATGFVIADRALEGNVESALTELRFALAVGLDPVLVTSALARQLRTVARVASAGRGAPDAIARELKLAPWMVDKARRQSRGWTPDRLVAAHAAVADADAEVKGGGTDPVFAAERAVRLVATSAEDGR